MTETRSERAGTPSPDQRNVPPAPATGVPAAAPAANMPPPHNPPGTPGNPLNQPPPHRPTPAQPQGQQGYMTPPPPQQHTNGTPHPGGAAVAPQPRLAGAPPAATNPAATPPQGARPPVAPSPAAYPGQTPPQQHAPVPPAAQPPQPAPSVATPPQRPPAKEPQEDFMQQDAPTKAHPAPQPQPASSAPQPPPAENALVVKEVSRNPSASGSGELIKADGGELARDTSEKGLSTELHSKRIPIGERMIEKGLIARDQLEIALKIQKDSKDKQMIGQILVHMGFITESALGEVLTEGSDTERFDPKQTIIDPTLIKQVPKDIAERYRAVPILLNDDKVYIAMTDIYNVLAIDRIQRYFPKRFKMVPVHCAEADLMDIVNNYYDYELSIDGILREMEALQSDDAEALTRLSSDQDSYTNPTVRLLDALLVDAIRLGTSDLHFEPEGSFVRLRYRIDGKLRLVRSFHKDYWSAIVVRIKIMSQMNITETRLPQDGRISLRILGRDISFRVATQPTIHGENVVMRVLDKQKALLPMPKLGFSEANVKSLQKALRRPEGIIIVTGPTGSGKSTTLYSILSYINKPDINIMTLEDPVEYELPLIRQSNIREGVGMDFVSGIKSLMRQDPDVIFVGEVRDIDTATMAIRAAMTGHQVYTSLHTNDALGAIPRLRDIGVEPGMLSDNIICIVAQRLARKLCDHCREEYEATPEDCKVLGQDPKKPPKLFRHKGCDICNHTGYKGRIGVSEVLVVDKKLDELIFQEASKGKMYEHIMQQGFIPMSKDGIDKVLKGVTDVDELVRTINMTELL